MIYLLISIRLSSAVWFNR